MRSFEHCRLGKGGGRHSDFNTNTSCSINSSGRNDCSNNGNSCGISNSEIVEVVTILF